MKMMTRATRHRADQKNPCGFGSDLSNFSDTAIAMLKNRFILEYYNKYDACEQFIYSNA